jgi:predicted amidohydrolase
MKVSVAQTRPFKGDIQKNIEIHKKLISLAISNGTDLIVFPELSLTGYEPELAKHLATNQEDQIFESFQEISNTNQISIGLGIPTKNTKTIFISMMLFQPEKPIETYSKQRLHEDELPYFSNGLDEVFLTIKNKKIAPAICYESLLPEHSEKAFRNGAVIYMTSVAKAENGIQKAFVHYSEIAKKHGMIVLISNCVGHCDNFESVGQSSIWDSNGVLVGQLNDNEEGVLIFDIESKIIIKKTIS